jgi:hypothetical protein
MVAGETFGKSGKPRFKNEGQFDSVGWANKTQLFCGMGNQSFGAGLYCQQYFPKRDCRSNDVAWHGLHAPLKYVRGLSASITAEIRFYVQLVVRRLAFSKGEEQSGGRGGGH